MNRNFLTILFSISLVFTISAQEKTNNSERIRQPTDCFVGTYQDWVKKDVVYIITAEEKNIFEALKTDEERENFVENFWRRRDPDPDTEENEFREAYYERIKYANDNFESGIPGWRTDRGKIYITYGKPDNIEKGRADFGNLKNILFETWSYKYLDSFCSEYQFTFTDPTQSDVFNLSVEEKEKLSKLPSNGLTQCYK